MSEVARGCQEFPECARSCQGVPKGVRRRQDVPGSRGCQELPVVVWSSQHMLGFPGVVRSCQEVWQKVSGCARMCQELPGGTDGLKDELMNKLPKLSFY